MKTTNNNPILVNYIENKRNKPVSGSFSILYITGPNRETP